MFVGSEPPGASLPSSTNGAALSLRAEAVVLERHEDGVRVAVVELEHVDVVERRSRPSRSASSPERFAPVLIAGSRPGTLVVAGRTLAEAEQVDGRLAQVARARSAEVTITAMPPFETRQQSKRCSGSTIQRDAW